MAADPAAPDAAPPWPAPAADYFRTAPRLTGALRRRFQAAVGLADAAPVDPGPALAGWVADLLLAVLPDHPFEVIEFLEGVRGPLAAHAGPAGPRRPGLRLFVIDGAALAGCGQGRLYRLATGDWDAAVRPAVDAAFCVRAYSLDALFRHRASELATCTTPPRPPSGPTATP